MLSRFVASQIGTEVIFFFSFIKVLKTGAGVLLGRTSDTSSQSLSGRPFLTESCSGGGGEEAWKTKFPLRHSLPSPPFFPSLTPW